MSRAADRLKVVLNHLDRSGSAVVSFAVFVPAKVERQGGVDLTGYVCLQAGEVSRKIEAYSEGLLLLLIASIC